MTATLEAVNSKSKLSVAEQISFFRSLATFMKAGIPLLRSLECLERQGESAPLREACGQLARELMSGQSFSSACARAEVAPEFAYQLLRCAEISGQLVAVLERLAQYYSDWHARQARLKVTLTYPMMLAGVCQVMAVVVPTVVLKDLLHSFQMEGNLPWPTALLLWSGQISSSPWFWLILVLLGVVLWRSPWPARWRLPLHQLLASVPGVRNLYLAHLQIRFLTCLSLQLRVGVPLLAALRLSLEATGSPLLEDARARIVTAVMDGEPLSQALLQEPLLGDSLSRLLEAGEEIGQVARVLEWMAEMTRDKLDYLQDMLLSLLEPMILMVMGVVVGVITCGTLMPTLKVLDKL